MKRADSVADGLGFEVGVGTIDTQLGKLWDEAGESKTRASLMNLVLYTEDREAMGQNTELIARIAAEHACRAILILSEPDSDESGVRAWINAHCHLAGKKQICSEQISFHLIGETAQALPNIVFSHLDSDLPLYLWWQAELRMPVSEELWSWVDRVLYDSAAWRDPAAGFAAAARIFTLAESRTTLGDLNWGRLGAVRHALAGVFDHPVALAHADRIDFLEIGYGPGFRTTACLLAGWLASRLGWEILEGGPLCDRHHSPITVRLNEEPGAEISSCFLAAGAQRFGIRRRGGHELFDLIISSGGREECSQVVGAAVPPREALLLEELARNARRSDYPEAFRIARAL